MKCRILLLFLLLLVCNQNTSFAVRFSQPVLIGTIYTYDGHVFLSKKALPSSKESEFYDFSNAKQSVRVYLEERAKGIGYFGATNSIKNAVDFKLVGSIDVFSVSTVAGEPFAYVIKGYGDKEVIYVDVIGIGKGGSFFRYANNEEFSLYFSSYLHGPMGNKCDISVSGNTLIFTCSAFLEDGKWQYLLHWNDDEEWFNIRYRTIN